MFTKFDSVTTLKMLIKFAAVALTSPATVAVASSLYPNDPFIRVIVSVAALILVEGCLLLGWEMLDQQGKTATMTHRWLYAGLAWVAYFSLFVVALSHNEGFAGLTFRLTLGVVLLYTSAEAGLLAGIRQDAAADAYITKHRIARKYRRDAAIRHAKLEIDAEYELSRLRPAVDRDVANEALKVDGQKRLLAVKNGHQAATGNVSSPEPFPYPIDKAQKRRMTKQNMARSETLDKILGILAVNPNASLREPADQIGRSHETVRQYLGTLERQGLIHRNGINKGVNMTLT